MPTAPKLTQLYPPASMPGADLHLIGTGLRAPIQVQLSGVAAEVTLSRAGRLTIQVPEGVLPGEVMVSTGAGQSNGLWASVGLTMADNVHPVSNPAVDAAGNVFVTLSGSRGQAMPVSIYKVVRTPSGTWESKPFAKDILNPTGLAFGPDGWLYCSSRADGTVYRISPEGLAQTYAEGLGVATGLAFDAEGALYVGDRSGTIFKIRPAKAASAPAPRPTLFKDFVDQLTRQSERPATAPEPEETPQETFVFATVEPSMAAYHLTFNTAGTLFVCGPTTSSNQAILAIDRDGEATTYFRGLGRAQGMAFHPGGDLFVAASLRGERGIIRITPRGEASLAVAGNNLVGLCFLPDGTAAIASRDALFWVVF